MEDHEEAFIRSRVFEHDGRIERMTRDLNDVRATVLATKPLSYDDIEDRIRKMIDKRMGCLIDKVVSVYDLYCGDRSLSVAEFEDKVRKLLSE